MRAQNLLRESTFAPACATIFCQRIRGGEMRIRLLDPAGLRHGADADELLIELRRAHGLLLPPLIDAARATTRPKRASIARWDRSPASA